MQAQVPSVEPNYRDRLDAAWAAHLAPREADAPTVISTFAGAGGSSLGYRMAGYKPLLAVEWDDHAVATYAENYPSTPIYHGDIAKLGVDEAMSLAGLGAPGELDVFDGSPPCQGFSTAGRRQMDDPRNQLFREYVRLLRGLRPKVFVMENVSGMVKGKMRLVFAEALTELKASGYVVECRLMNAMYFGAPQSRERLIFIGVREDLGVVPSYPTPAMQPIVLRDALPRIGGDPGLAFRQPLDEQGPPPALKGKYLGLAPKVRPLECAADYDHGKGFQGLVRASWARPHGTLSKMNPGTGFGTPLHPEENRSLSIAEAKRIGSFPDQFKLEGEYADCWARIGNSVPPFLMRAITQHIRTLNVF